MSANATGVTSDVQALVAAEVERQMMAFREETDGKIADVLAPAAAQAGPRGVPAPGLGPAEGMSAGHRSARRKCH